MTVFPFLLTVGIIIIAFWAFREAELKGRIFILSVIGLTFLLPRVFPSVTMMAICLTARILLALGCLVYLKWRGGIFTG